MKWEELIAEARAAGVLKFCAEGIAVLQQVPTHAAKEKVSSQPDQRLPGGDREERRDGGNGESQGAQQ